MRLMMSDKVAQLKTELLEKGKINADDLVLVMAGNEQLIAEWRETENNLQGSRALSTDEAQESRNAFFGSSRWTSVPGPLSPTS
jgi:hypothetical protein